MKTRLRAVAELNAQFETAMFGRMCQLLSTRLSRGVGSVERVAQSCAASVVDEKRRPGAKKT